MSAASSCTPCFLPRCTSCPRRRPEARPISSSNSRKICYTVFFFFLLLANVLLVAGGGSRSERRSVRGGSGSVWEYEERFWDRAAMYFDLLSEHRYDSPLALYAAILRAEPRRCFVNFLVSPFSVWKTFRALEFGAGGQTVAEMRRFFHEEKEDFLIPGLIPPAFFGFGERIYVTSDRDDQQLLSYGDRLRAIGTEVALFDFRSRQDAVTQINAFISENTEDLIDGVVSSSDLRTRPDVIAVNAAVLKAQWKKPFTEIFQDTFHAILPDHFWPVEQGVTFMQRTFGSEEVSYTSLDDAEVIRLPFTDSRLGMYIVLPNAYEKFLEDVEGLPDLLHHRIAAAMFKDEEQPQWREVRVRIPRFRIAPEECKVDLIPVMDELGIAHLSQEADFSRMSDRGRALRLDVWNHQTGFEADENGVFVSEAAAESVAAVGSAVDEPPLDFIANRPFFFSIIYQPDFEDPQNLGTDDTILFSGHVVNAEAAQQHHE